MIRLVAVLFFSVFVFCGGAFAGQAPLGNPYDVLSKVLQPILGVFLAGEKTPGGAMRLEAKVEEVQGRLPKQFAGAEVKFWAQYPDKLKMVAPFGGESFTVVRNGKEAWAQPGDKIEFLLGQFRQNPPATPVGETPFALPFNAQQALFAIMLFNILDREVAEVEEVGGEMCRVLTVVLQPEVGKAVKAEDFKLTIWVDGSYRLRRAEVGRRDFRVTVGVEKLVFSPSLPAETWALPEGATNVYRTGAEQIEALLYVGLNSLQMSEKGKSDK